MCGIVAVISKSKWSMSKDECDMFSDLLYVDALRGMDSTGMFMVDRDGDIEILKEASDASTFRSRPEFRGIMQAAYRKGIALVGHNRAATKGAITDQNAHPFVVDDRITLVHNGTLYNHKQLADTEVDSHAIAHLIHKHDDNVEAAMQEISGAYALIWSDFKNGSVNILRNSQRPMHWVETDKCWIYCSEQNMIEWLRHRYDKVKFESVMSQPAGTLTTFTRNKDEWGVVSKELTLTKPVQYSAPAGGQEDSKPFRGFGNYGEFIDDDGVIDYFWPEDENKGLNEQKEEKKDTPKQLTLTEKLQQTEDKLAKDHRLNLLFTEFSDTLANLPDNTYMEVTCIDFDQWDINTERQGCYLYGRLDGYDALVRVFIINKEYSEYDLLDFSLNNTKMEFYVRSKSWRAYKDRQGGYALLYATAVRPIASERQTLLENFNA